MKTAIYCRVSSRGQKDNYSIPEQERFCRHKAAQLGWEVSEAHVYHEVEGGEDLDRPRMYRLLDAIQAREIDGLLVDVLDRLSRDEDDQANVYWHAERYGAKIELASQDIDESEHGRNLRTLMGMAARIERNNLKRRTQGGRRARVTEGKMLTGAHPLYGYWWAGPEQGKRTRYVVDPETAPVVIRIFRTVAAGVPIRQLVRELEHDGVPTPYQVLASRGMLPAGRAARPVWQRAQITRMLRNPAYWGEHSAYRHSITREKFRVASTGVMRKLKRQSEGDADDPNRVALPNACPAIVSKELAERAHAQLEKNKKDNPTRNPDPLATIWRTMAYCGHCGYRMFTAPSMPGEGRKYRCRSRPAVDGLPVDCPGGKFTMNATVLDASGWADVRAWLRDEDNVRRLLAEWEQEENSVENSVAARLEASAANIKRLRDDMDSLGDAIAETRSREARQSLQDKLEIYADRLRKEEAKRERLLSDASDAATHAQDARNIREWVSVVASYQIRLGSCSMSLAKFP